jgi:hypothetical protein
VRFVAAGATKAFVNKNNPKAGEIVSFKHHGFLFANKKPKFPVLYRIRHDLTWQDVINNWREHKVSVYEGNN